MLGNSAGVASTGEGKPSAVQLKFSSMTAVQQFSSLTIPDNRVEGVPLSYGDEGEPNDPTYWGSQNDLNLLSKV